jgi:N-glycosylase/DNA lyase
VGVEGQAWYRVAVSESGYEVESNGTREDFSRLFRLDWDGEAVEREILGRGPEMAPYLELHRGLRLMRPSSAVETLVSFLCASNNHLKRIGAMVGKLSELGPLFSGTDFRRFPSLSQVACVGEARLREWGFGYRAATICRAAAELEARGGEAYLEGLRRRAVPEVRAELVSLPGVGRKLADCILLFGLDRHEVIPVDTHIRTALTRLYFGGSISGGLTAARYQELATFFENRFGELSGWAQQALFFDRVLNWRQG